MFAPQYFAVVAEFQEIDDGPWWCIDSHRRLVMRVDPHAQILPVHITPGLPMMLISTIYNSLLIISAPCEDD